MDRGDSNTKSQLLTRRAALLGGAQVVLLGTLAGRMYYLQVVQADRYAMLADENRINIRLVAPPRGRILDRFGAVLADNRPTYSVVLVAEQANDIPSTLDAVATLIPLTDTDRHRVVRDIRRKHSFVPVMIRENLSWEEMARIEVNALELPGVSIEEGLIRHYPFRESISHVLGYVAAVSETELTGDDPLLELPDFRIGKDGVEKEHDLDLRGSAGTSQVEVNAYGRVVRELAREDGIAGAEVVLTIDMALQDLAARRCAAEKSAASVVMDAWTGEVLAMVSTPGYDPHGFVTGWTPAQWAELNDDRKALMDKALAGTYAPGSTFKPIVALAALEANVITPDMRFSCPGFFQFGNVTFHCWKKGGHGSMDLHDGIKHSCDVYFFELAHRTGIDRIADMAKRFGLGGELGIDVPGEATGLIPNGNYTFKGAYGAYKWQPGDTISAGIGQSVITVTPLQLATYAARLASGRAVMPHLTRTAGVMKSEADGAPPPAEIPAIKVSRKDLSLVLAGMNAVVNEQGGTAYAARISEPGLQMGGKSGTSQVRRITQYEREHGLRKIKDVPWKERDHALFISFAPVSAPRYVCATVVEHGGESAGGGSAVAAPICRDLLRDAQQRDPARRVPEHPFGAETTVAQE